MNKIPDSRRYTHDYEGNAKGYADLDIANTFALAYREIERIVKDNGLSGQAIDVGCGGGRSTRFLKSLGLPCIGVDIEPVQVEQSLKKDPSGDYRIAEKGVIPIQSCSFDLSLSCIALLECPSITDLESAVAEIARVTKVGGHVIVVTNSEDA
ncbi:MAG: class I SAM-dependent methyltransferase, partial [Bdellovibrionales bacterium]|nr:class I SAM-dependent methyltransferase [Bdellovibrionales bacterium]